MAHTVIVITVLIGQFSLFAAKVCEQPIRTAAASLVGLDVQEFDARAGNRLILLLRHLRNTHSICFCSDVTFEVLESDESGFPLSTQTVVAGRN